jgi:ribosomal protein S18 acetylase RimI-like enzyme
LPVSDALTVRWATPDDAEAIARIHVESWRATYPGLLPDEILAGLDVGRRTEQWRGWLSAEPPVFHTLVAEYGAELAGFLAMAFPARDAGEADDVAEIPALYLDPKRRRQGIGRALMDAALKAMKARGYREAILWILGGNEGAAAFYEATGWRDDGGRRGSQYFPDLRELVEVRYRRALTDVSARPDTG